jgi:hypothetical protein
MKFTAASFDTEIKRFAASSIPKNWSDRDVSRAAGASAVISALLSERPPRKGWSHS